MTKTTDTSALSLLACDKGFDPIEDRLRVNIRSTIEAVFSEELDSFLGRLRYGREAGAVKRDRHGHRDRPIAGTFGTETISVARARVENEDGKLREWRSKALPRYQRLTKSEEEQKTAWGAVFPTNEALIASVYLSGTNTRPVKRALLALFEGAVSIRQCRSELPADAPPVRAPLATAHHWLIVVSWAWRKVKTDWDARCARSLEDEDIVRARRRPRGSDPRPSGSNRWRHDGRPPPLATHRTVASGCSNQWRNARATGQRLAPRQHGRQDADRQYQPPL